MIQFNPSTGFSVEDTAIIRQRQQEYWISVFATDPELPPLNVNAESPAGQLIDGETALIAQKDSELLYLANAFNPKTSTGKFQDALGQIYFISRQVAQPTYVTCQCFGLYGTVIPYGAIVQSTDGFTFVNTAPATIGTNGTVTIIVRCSETGAVSVAPGAIAQIITTIPGWDSITNEASGTIGRAEETQAEFENRRYESVAKNSHGSVAAIYGTLSNIPNVVACRVLENRTDSTITLHEVELKSHSVYISIYGGDDDAIASGIYHKIDGGCGTNGNTLLTYTPTEEDEDQPGAVYTYAIERPATVDMAVLVEIRNTSSTPTNIEQLVKDAIIANFNGETTNNLRVAMAQTVFASRFYCSVVEAGVEDLIKITIAYPAGSAFVDSVEIPANQIPVINEANITVQVDT